MAKPDVDAIDGLSPAISIEQRTVSRSPRSTVGTLTEITDHLRLLYARAGTPHCWKCDRVLSSQSVAQMADRVLTRRPRARAPAGWTCSRPWCRAARASTRRSWPACATRASCAPASTARCATSPTTSRLARQKIHDIDVVVDRIVVKESARDRIAGSLETALELSGGLVWIQPEAGEPELLSASSACAPCGVSFPELAPRLFSFNGPHGACPRCGGLGSRDEFDPERIVPEPERSLEGGAIAPWRGRRQARYYQQLLESVTEHLGIDLETPWRDLPKRAQKALLYGTGTAEVRMRFQRRRRRATEVSRRFDGVIGEPGAGAPGRRPRVRGEVHVAGRLPRLRGHAAARGGARRAPGRALAARALGPPARRGRRLSREREARRHGAGHRGARAARDPRAAALPARRRPRLPHPRSPERHALRRRGPAHPPRHPGGVEPDGRALHPRRAVHRPASARQRAPAPEPRAPARRRQQRARGRARRGHRAPRGLGGRHGSRRRPPRRLRGRRGDARRDRGQRRLPDRRLPVGAPRASRSRPGVLAIRPGSSPSRAAASTTSRTWTCALPLGLFNVVTGVSGSGKSTLVIDTLHRALATRLHKAEAPAGAHDRIEGLDADRQGGADRSGAHRPHAAQQPRHLHRHVRRDPQAPGRRARVARARLRAGPLLLQREGRPLRVVSGRRPDPRGDALPPRPLRHVRGVPRPPLQPRDPRGALQGQDRRRGPGGHGGGGPRDLRERALRAPPAPDAARRGPRLPAPRPAGDDALGWRGPAREALARALPPRHRPHALHPRRAHHRPAPGRRGEAARGAPAAGRAWATPSS